MNTVDELMREMHRLEGIIQGAHDKKKSLDRENKAKKLLIDKEVSGSRLKLKHVSRLIALYGAEVDLPGLGSVVEPSRSYPCEHCTEVFTRPQGLGVHNLHKHGIKGTKVHANRKQVGNDSN